MNISANVVQDPGTKPNWRGSIDLSRVGLRSHSIMMLSAALDKVDVVERGRRSLLKSSTIGPFGTSGVVLFVSQRHT